MPIHALGDSFTVDGNGTILSLPTLQPGATIWLKISGTPTFKNSSKLILQSGADYTARAGDLVVARSVDDGVWRIYPLPGVGVREILTASRTYYVRTDGNDANTGLVNSAFGAKLTLQAAWNAAAALDANGQTITISVADGTYTAGISAAAPILGAGSISITGNTTTPASCVINCTNANCFLFDSIVQLVIIGAFKLTTATAGDCIIVRNNANVRLSGTVAMDFGACAGGHVTIDGASFASNSNYNITGGAALAHMHVINWGNVGIDGITVTLTGTPNFGSYFAGIASGILTATGCTLARRRGSDTSCMARGILKPALRSPEALPVLLLAEISTTRPMG